MRRERVAQHISTPLLPTQNPAPSLFCVGEKNVLCLPDVVLVLADDLPARMTEHVSYGLSECCGSQTEDTVAFSVVK